jgi:hypothetical protein
LPNRGAEGISAVYSEAAEIFRLVDLKLEVSMGHLRYGQRRRSFAVPLDITLVGT